MASGEWKRVKGKGFSRGDGLVAWWFSCPPIHETIVLYAFGGGWLGQFNTSRRFFSMKVRKTLDVVFWKGE